MSLPTLEDLKAKIARIQEVADAAKAMSAAPEMNAFGVELSVQAALMRKICADAEGETGPSLRVIDGGLNR